MEIFVLLGSVDAAALEPSAASLLETFAAVARRRATGATSQASSTNANNSRSGFLPALRICFIFPGFICWIRNTANSLNSSGLFGGRGLATSSVSSLVRLALSTNFPGALLNQVHISCLRLPEVA